MAEVTALRNNCFTFPIYGFPFTVVVPILDADGDLVTGATALDSEISQNGDTFADCTNEATEIATSSGMYYLSLTAAEMTADIASIIIKTSSSGAKTTPVVFYPAKFPTVASGTATAGAAGTITLEVGSVAADDYFNGCCLYISAGTGNGQARMITDYVGSTRVATVTPSFATNPGADSVYTIVLSFAAVNALFSNISAIALATLSATTAQLGVNIVQIAGNSTAGSNLRSMFDGTGYSGGTEKLKVEPMALR